MIDIHNHLVPEVDDGSRSVNESIDMIKMMISSGYSGAITTSHYDSGRYLVDKEKVLIGIKKINNKLTHENINFKLYPGNEIQIDIDTIKNLKNNTCLSLNNSRYVLSEFPMVSPPNYAENILYNLQLEGFIPIIAHPERYTYVRENPNWLLKFIKSGCLVQINLKSLTDDSKITAINLIERNMIHFVGTDSHRSDWRTPEVKNELKILKEIISEDKYKELTVVNPSKIINNEFISSQYSLVQNNKENSSLNENKNTKKWYEFWR